MDSKFIRRGVALGIAVVTLHKLLAFSGMSELAFPLFFLLTLMFLLVNSIVGLFICGFTGLAIVIGCETVFAIPSIMINIENWLDVYIEGFLGCMSAIPAGVILTFMKHSFGTIEIGEIPQKRRAVLSIYGIITAITFGFMILCDSIGAGMSVFAFIQLVMLCFIIEKKQRLLWFIPIIIISVNPLVSASDIWLISNSIIMTALGAIMMSDVTFTSAGGYAICAFERIYTAFENLLMPLRTVSFSKDKKSIFKRLLIALIITLPFAIVLIYILSSIDLVFLDFVEGFMIEWSFEFIVDTALSILAALFLTAMAYSVGFSRERKSKEAKVFNTDLLIVNTFLSVIVTIYALFAVVQFKYLFAGGALPYDLTYTEYARRGFFELLSLTGVNILAILIIVRLTRGKEGMWNNVTKSLLCGLCAVTIVMLASSFYRMYLYSADDGLTRLRTMVFGFLIFEALSLVVTFAYIIRPKFSITAVYLAAGLTYYCILNVVPIDSIIAKNQIDRYFAGDTSGVDYVFTLSADAAPEVERLLENTDDSISYNAMCFLREHYSTSKDNSIFSFCIPEYRLKKICEKHNIEAFD